MDRTQDKKKTDSGSPDIADKREFILNELCLLTDTPVRTVRYYIQMGLVDRPSGGTRAARYGAKHIEQLLTIKKWAEAGLSLERIRELIHGETPPCKSVKARGSVEVKSHLTISDGLELVVEPETAAITPTQLRRLAREIASAYERVLESDE
jgi:DNA-binding transcriptional MerR regulator